MRGMIPSDDNVTAMVARRVLAAARELGTDGYSWYVGGGVFSRASVLDMMDEWLDKYELGDALPAIVAMRIREEFGVDGKKAARKKPRVARKYKPVQPWPTGEST